VSGYAPDARDPGLAAERTDLAWNRSGLALLACGAALLKGFPPAGVTAHQIVGAVILVLGGFTWGLGAWQARRRSRPGLARAAPTPRDVLPVALGAAGVGTAALVVAAFYPG
jgi:putative membrane protein